MKSRLIGEVASLTLVCLISGCLNEDTRVTLPASGIIQRQVSEPSQAEQRTDRAPVISGIQHVSVTLNEEFVFRPTAWDPDDDPLRFSIRNKPEWIEFDELSGTLKGLPGEREIGTYSTVVIGASDGHSTSYLDVTIQVVPDTTRAVTLEWYPPTLNADDTPLMDLAGYRIRYGPDPDNHSYEIDIPNPGITTYVVPGVVSGTHYFVLSAYNSLGVESEAASTVIEL